MNTRKRHLFRWIAVAFAAAAAAAPAVQAAGVSPDDRAFSRGTSAELAPASVSPDDRPLFRGSSEALAANSLSPDDRPFSRSARAIEPSSAPADVVASPGGFDWGDALLGGTFGLALALLGAGGLWITRHRRSSGLRTA